MYLESKGQANPRNASFILSTYLMQVLTADIPYKLREVNMWILPTTGFKVERSGHTNDERIDGWMMKDDNRYVIKAKRYVAKVRAREAYAFFGTSYLV